MHHTHVLTMAASAGYQVPEEYLLHVFCGMKDSGCPWKGPLKNLETHLQTCLFVDVECPRNCGQRVQRLALDSHISNDCPTQCPNGCGANLKRAYLEEHLKVCPLQKIQCAYSSVGCEAEFVRENENKHMELSAKTHLALVEVSSLQIRYELQQQFDRALQELYKVFEQKLEERDTQIHALRESLRKQQDDFEHSARQHDIHVKTLAENLGSRINSLHIELGVPPYEITLTDYQVIKDQPSSYSSPPMYTHSGGYKFDVTIWPCGWESGRGTHVSVTIDSIEQDTELAYPAKFIITLELLNQHRDGNHYTKELEWTVNKPGDSEGSDNQFISHDDLKYNFEKQTQYLRNDCLKFRVTKIISLITKD